MSCAEGTVATTGANEFTPIEKLFEGAELLGLPEDDEAPARVIEPLQFAMSPCVQIKTAGGHELTCELGSALRLSGGGCVSAEESLGRAVLARNGSTEVVKVKKIGPRRIVRLKLDPPYVYEANGLLTQEE